MSDDKDNLLISASQASDLLKCMANPHRLLLICHLMDGAKPVGQLAELVGIGQSNMSQHLSQLRLNGVVRADRQAQSIYYSLASEAARELVAVLHSQFCSVKPLQSGKKSRKRTA